MPEGDWLPSSDSDLIAWGQTFVNYITTNQVILGLIPAEVAAISGPYTAFVNSFVLSEAANNAAAAATQAKEDARANFEDPTRSQVAQLQAAPATTDAQRAGMGITVRDTTRTPAAAPTTRPVVEIDISDRLRHIIKFRDELTPDSRKKPAGVREAEIWHRIAETEPVNEADYLYLAGDSATPYVASYNGSDAGKTVWYLLRWKNTRGVTGPWSFPLSAKVPG